MTEKIYPWLEPYWQKLSSYQKQNALPNALMLVGERGFGYQSLIKQFANSVFCTQLNAHGFACGKCEVCSMHAAGTYPDFKVIEPEEGDATIKIAAVRKLIGSLSLSRQYDTQRIVIIAPVDEMLRGASNSLLKTLEEPNDGTTIILLAHNLAKVPATIKSRCQLISARNVDEKAMLQWLDEEGCAESKAYLQLANGAPLYAKKYWETQALSTHNDLFKLFLDTVQKKIDPLVFSEHCSKLKDYPITRWISSWLTDAIILSYDEASVSIANADLFDNLKLLSKKLHLKQLYSLLDQVADIARLESGQVNKQLLFDELAINSSSNL